MGKRELVLLVGFIVVGVVVYQATSPPPKPGERAFSLVGLITHLRREVGANAATAQLSRASRHPLDRSLRELRISGVQRLTVIGEPRPDLAAEFSVESTGFDPSEARALAEQTELRLTPSGDILVVDVKYPRAGRQRGDLALRVPDHLALTLGGIRGDVSIRGVRQAIRGEQRDGRLEVVGGSRVRLVTRRSRVRLENIAGETVVDATDGELELKRVAGEVRIEARRLDVDIDATVAPVDIAHSDGRVAIAGATAPVRIEGRRTRIRLRLDAPTLVSAFTTDEPIEVDLPTAGGLTIDAIATAGTIRMADPSAHVTNADNEQRATLQLRGGGALVTLRNTRGDVVVRN